MADIDNDKISIVEKKKKKREGYGPGKSSTVYMDSSLTFWTTSSVTRTWMPHGPSTKTSRTCGSGSWTSAASFWPSSAHVRFSRKTAWNTGLWSCVRYSVKRGAMALSIEKRKKTTSIKRAARCCWRNAFQARYLAWRALKRRMPSARPQIWMRSSRVSRSTSAPEKWPKVRASAANRFDCSHCDVCAALASTLSGCM